MGKMKSSAKPIRMWIDGKCFNIRRFKKPKESTSGNKDSQDSSNADASTSDHNFSISPAEDGRLATAFRLPSMYYVRLSSFPDFNLKNLETKTNTSVVMPKLGNTGSIIITGNNELDIVNAREMIQSVVSEIRDRQRALQFIAIPVHSEEVQRNFEQFKQEILSGTPIPGMDETIFQSSAKLHLTIVVFSLMDDTEKNEAVAALNDCKAAIIEPLITGGPLKIKVAGIDCMNENLEKVNILYANAKIEHENEDVLQKLANGISDFFYERGLVRQYQDNVKLHVTLMNTKYRKPSRECSPIKKRMRQQTFDARSIIEKYKDYYFGESLLDSIHLSNISSQGDDGFYKSLSVVKL